MFHDKSILITGGTGSFGHTFVPMTLARYQPCKLKVNTRDEIEQQEMTELLQCNEK